MSKPYAKPVAQRRSRVTRDKLMAALERLLKQKDFDQIAISDLASEAGVAVGTVYRRFENKDALIPLLFDLWMARSQEQTKHARVEADQLDPAKLRPLLRQQIRAAYRFAGQQAHILRAVYLYGRLRPDLIGDEWKALWGEARDGTVNFLRIVIPGLREEDLGERAEMLVYLSNTALVEKAIFGDDGAGFVVSAEGDAFADGIADAVYGYLTLERIE